VYTVSSWSAPGTVLDDTHHGAAETAGPGSAERADPRPAAALPP
jgi:hypothetical protein